MTKTLPSKTPLPKTLLPIDHPDMNRLYRRYGMPLRSSVLFNSLQVESAAKGALEILDRMNGVPSKRLRVEERIERLIESDFLDAKNKKSIKLFLKIRNQFIHNAQARTMKQCFEVLDIKPEMMFREYPPERRGKGETALQSSFLVLTVDVLSAIKDMSVKSLEGLVDHLDKDRPF